MKEIILDGVVGWDFTPADLRSQLPKDNSPVRFVVNSPGGFAWDGIELHNIIRSYKGETESVINALGASAASIFPLASDKVFVRETSTMMIHRSWGGIIGNTIEVAKKSEILSGLDGILAGIYSKKTGKPEEEILSKMTEETWFFGGQSAIDYGLADEILEDENKIEPIPPEQAKALVAAVFEKAKSKDNAEGLARAERLIKTNSKDEKKIYIKEKKNMTLEEFLTSPHDKKEYEVRFKETVEEWKAKVVAAGAFEKTRIDEIIKLSGAILSEEAASAITNGIDPGEFAKTLIRVRNNVLESARESGAKVAVQTSKEQTPGSQAKAMTEVERSLAAADEAVDKSEKEPKRKMGS